MRFVRDNDLMLEAVKRKKPKESCSHIGIGGTQYWFNDDGQRHRLDGPAVTLPDGAAMYYVNGQHMSKHEFDNLFGKYTSLEDRQVIVDMEGMFD